MKVTKLPNGDIYIPQVADREPRIDNVRISTDEAPTTPQQAVEQEVKNALGQKRDHECMWCGSTYPDEAVFKRHLFTQHADQLADSAIQAQNAMQQAGARAMRRV